MATRAAHCRRRLSGGGVLTAGCKTVPPERVRTGPSMIVHGAESPAPEPRKSCKLLGMSIAGVSLASMTA